MHVTPPLNTGEAFTQIAEKIRANDPTGQAELHRLLWRSTRYYFAARVGAETEDLTHDVFITTVRAIQRCQIRDSRCLMSYVTTIAKRLCARHIDAQVWQRSTCDSDAIHFQEMIPDNNTNIESDAIAAQQRDIAAKVLDTLRARDREILVRFYIREQRREQIMAEMGLTETQFRLIKSRAKAEFSKRAFAAMQSRPLSR
jgi:RNA polymerase sigma-70 factor, ECF subfamily